MLENPIYPDIKKGPPRFVWSKKHWTADASVLLDTEPITQFIEPAILVQNRDYNQFVYGKSSHRDIVNANFRPPLLDPYEDNYALTRIPVTTRAIIPHINPGTAGHDGGTSGYAAKNNYVEVLKALTDRVSTAGARPTFFAPIEIPADNSILPDLESKLPSYSTSAGWEIPLQISAPNPEITLYHNQLHPSGNSGYNPGIRIDGESGMENLDLDYNRPQVSVTSGYRAPNGFTKNGEMGEYELYNKRPNYSVSAGFDTPLTADGDIAMPELNYNRPQVSVSAGFDNPITINGDIAMPHLDYNRPQVSASSGFDTPITINGDIAMPELDYNRPQVSVDARSTPNITFDAYNARQDMVLDSKLDPSIFVVNPGSENGFRERMMMNENTDNYIQDKKPNYSYVVPAEIPTYRETNSRTLKPHFRQRLQTDKAYGQVSQTGGYIPRMNGMENLMVHLKKDIIANSRKKVSYSIGK